MTRLPAEHGARLLGVHPQCCWQSFAGWKMATGCFAAAACMRTDYQADACDQTQVATMELCRGKKNRSDITPDPGGHRSQRPCAEGRTRAKQDQVQVSAPGQNQTRSVGGATTHGRRTRQAGESVPT